MLPFRRGSLLPWIDRNVADPCRCLYLVRKISALKAQGHIDQADEHRYLDQGADDRGECLARIDAEDGHGHGDGQFEVVGRRGEAQGGGPFDRSAPTLFDMERKKDTRNMTTK